MKFGLTDNQFIKICQTLSKYAEVECAILYGSRAKGNYRPGSDIDLTLLGPDLTYDIINKIECELDDSYLPYKFDISIHHRITDEAVLEHITRVGKLFFQKTENVISE